METAESMESLDYCFPLHHYKESAVFTLSCWQNVCLSDIWIPANLLSTKDKSSNSHWINHGVYHTLQKEDHARCIESFSLYNDSEEQTEIFESDSDDEILFSSGNNSCEENINNITSLAENKSSEIDALSDNFAKSTANHKLYENVDYNKIRHLQSCENVNPSKIEHFESNENISKNDLSIQTKTASDRVYGNVENSSGNTIRNQYVNKIQNTTDSQISLNEILDNTPDINLNKFSVEFKKKDVVELKDKLDRKKELNVKRMNKKERQLKKKASKTVALDELPQHEVYEDDCMNPFYQSILRKKLLASYSAEERNNIEFPKLVVVDEAKCVKSESDKFIKSDKPHVEKNSDIRLQTVIDIIAKTTETAKEEIESEVVMPVEDEIKTEVGKMVIENIPFDVAEEDIYCILLGYGEIKNFTLKPDGKFLKAFVEMDLICNIDWIVECLNGTDPFGASSETLKCHNVTNS